LAHCRVRHAVQRGHQHAGRAGQRRADGKGDPDCPAGVDAHQAGRLRVDGGGANRAAEPRPEQKRLEQNQKYDRAQDDDDFEQWHAGRTEIEVAWLPGEHERVQLGAPDE